LNFISRGRLVMKRMHALQCVLIIAALSTDNVTADAGPGQNYLGVNLGSVLDWEGNIVFADAMKSARGWCTPDNTWTLLPAADFDTLEWPTRDDEGRRVGSGVYLLRLLARSGFTATRKMLLLD